MPKTAQKSRHKKKTMGQMVYNLSKKNMIKKMIMVIVFLLAILVTNTAHARWWEPEQLSILYGYPYGDDTLYFHVHNNTEATLVGSNDSISGALVIPSQVPYIRECVQNGEWVTCTDMVTITKIGGRAFRGCNNLTSVVIPSSITQIDGEAFKDCINLASVQILGAVVGNYNNGGIFSGCYSLTDVLFPEWQYVIPDDMFGDCYSLSNVNIPNTVYIIGCSAFSGCSNLSNIVFPDSLFAIRNDAFSHCYNLTGTITLPNYVRMIGNSAFNSCIQIDTVLLPDSVGVPYTGTFGGVFNLFVFEGGIGNDVFDNCSNLKHISLPNGLPFLGDGVFRSCYSLTNVTIPNSVKRIGDYCFAGCSGIDSIVIPDSVVTIDYCAFSGCTGLTSLILGNSVDSIRSSAFNNCSGIKKMTIPASVSYLATDAFSNCSLDTCIFKPQTPPFVVGGWDTWSIALAHVPCGTGNAYRNFIMNHFIPISRVMDTCDTYRNLTLLSSGGLLQYIVEDYNPFSTISQSATDTVTVTVLDSSELRLRLYTILPGTEAAAEFGLSSRLMRLLVNGVEFPLNSETCEIRDYSNDGGYIQYRVNMVVDTDMTIEAVYVPYINATVSALASDSTLGSVTGGGTCYYFDEVVLSACASVGSTFLGWSNGSTQNPLTLEVMSDTTLVAYFTSGNSADTIFIHIHDTTYIDMPYAVHDTTIIDIHDTTYVNVPYAVHDTTYIDVYVHDTTTIIDTLTLIEYMTVHDTTYIDVHDTTYIDVPYAVHDTTYITLINTIYDTITNTVYDTVTNTVYDTIDNFVYDTLTVTDTLWLTQIDTLWLRDTVIIHDTIYITQEGIDGVEAMNAKVYSSNGQIVVDGAAGNTVWLYDINGRVLATKRDENTPLCFDAPASGTYLIKIGGHPARKVVVIR